MIPRDKVRKVGRLLKPYSYKGEILLLFDRAVFAEVETDFYFFEIDGLFVPFFVDEINFNGATLARVKFNDVNDEAKAAQFANVKVFLAYEKLREVMDETEFSWRDFIGFQIFDDEENFVGVIADVDDATINTLFLVEKDENQVMIPATEDFITNVDSDRKKLFMQLPEGLL